MNKAALAIIASIIVTGCSAPTNNSVSAQATLIVAGGNAQIASAQETRAAEQAQAQMQARYAIATATAQALNAQTDSEISEVMIEQARAGATATAVSIKATVQAISRQAEIDSVTALSNTFVITAQAALKAEQVQRQRDKENDWLWMLPDYIVHAAPCGGVVLLLVAGYLLVRALAARLAGDEKRAEMVLRSPSITFLLPAPHSPAMVIDNYDEDDTETRITGNTGNTPENTGNTAETIVFNHGTTSKQWPRLTTEQHIQLSKAKALCLDWLYRARSWDTENNRSNNYIPRHDKIKMKPEDAGDAREMLDRIHAIYVKQGGKPDEQGTYVMPDYGTIDNLIALIRSGDLRVSPPDFDQEILKQWAILDSAVNALPEAN